MVEERTVLVEAVAEEQIAAQVVEKWEISFAELDAEKRIDAWEEESALDEQAAMEGQEEYLMIVFHSSCVFSVVPLDCVRSLQEQSKTVLDHLPFAVSFVRGL
jgi:hypothetical protein